MENTLHSPKVRMANRDVSIGICGVVVGVILGAGVLAFSDGTAVQATVAPVAYRVIPKGGVIPRRQVQGTVQPVDRSRAPTVKDVVVPAEETPVVTEETPCTIAGDIVKEVAAANDKVLPVNIKNTAIRQTLRETLEGILLKYCKDQHAAAATSSSSASSVEPRDNDCHRFVEGTSRYNQCRVNETQGKSYP